MFFLCGLRILQVLSQLSNDIQHDWFVQIQQVFEEVVRVLSLDPK